MISRKPGQRLGTKGPHLMLKRRGNGNCGSHMTRVPGENREAGQMDRWRALRTIVNKSLWGLCRRKATTEPKQVTCLSN